MSKIKKYYPDAGSATIVDKRGVGFTLYSTHDHYLIDPLLIRRLAQLYLKHKHFTMTKVVTDVEGYISEFLEVRDDFIRGNTFPVALGEGSFAQTSTAALARMSKVEGLTDDELEIVSYIMAHVLSGFKMVEIEARQQYHGTYYRDNSLLPLVSKLTADSLIANVLLSQSVSRDLKVLFASIDAAQKATIKADKGGYRSVLLSDISFSVRRCLVQFDSAVRSARSKMMPMLRSLSKVLAYARTHANTYVPAGMSVTEVGKLLKYANSFFYLPRVKDEKPTITDESLTKKLLETFASDLGGQDSLFEEVPTSHFQGVFKQFNITMPFDTTKNVYLKTQWMLPGLSAPQAACITKFADDGDGLYSINVDEAMSHAFTWIADGLMNARSFFEQKWDATDRSTDGFTTEQAVDRDLTAISVYGSTFHERVIRSVAIDICVDFDVSRNGSLITYEYVDYTNRPSFGAVAAPSQRYSRTNDGTRVIAHTALSGANEASAFKHPNLLPMMPSSNVLVRGVKNLLTNDSEVKSYETGKLSAPLHRIAGTVDTTGEGFVSETPDSIAFNIITPKGEVKSTEIMLADIVDSDIFAIADTYLELGADYAFTDAYISQKAAEVLALSEGATKHELAKAFFILLGGLAEAQFSGLILDALRKYTVLTPDQLEKRMSRELTINKRKNAITAYLAILKHLGLKSADEMTNLINYATTTLSQTELAGE